MNKRFAIFNFLVLTSVLVTEVHSSEKKKVVYKSHTQLDFTGDKIEGKIKAPAVFYIFQRKRSLGHEAARSPGSLNFHETSMKEILQESVKE